jgi:hypothetical protein
MFASAPISSRQVSSCVGPAQQGHPPFPRAPMAHAGFPMAQPRRVLMGTFFTGRFVLVSVAAVPAPAGSARPAASTLSRPAAALLAPFPASGDCAAAACTAAVPPTVSDGTLTATFSPAVSEGRLIVAFPAQPVCRARMCRESLFCVKSISSQFSPPRWGGRPTVALREDGRFFEGKTFLCEHVTGQEGTRSAGCALRVALCVCVCFRYRHCESSALTVFPSVDAAGRGPRARTRFCCTTASSGLNRWSSV